MITIPETSFYTILIIVFCIIFALILLFFTIINLILSKMETDKYAEKKYSDDLKDNFYNTLNEVTKQKTGEILECLIEMEKLDNIYREIKERHYSFMDDLSYLKLKEDTLDKIIKEKIETIKTGKKKKEKLTSLQDELETCRNRYPEYNEVYIKNKRRITLAQKPKSK